jgi:DNA-binding transcriptional MerR regulator
MYKVNELAVAAGVTVRTLHYYDKIGLLRPVQYTQSGYRLYGEEDALRLQQILFYRELGLSLEEIGKILGRPDFDLVAALESHKAELGGRIARLRQLSRTVENTISYLKGEKTMKQAGIFSGFTPEEEELYAMEAEKIYDPDTVKESNRKWKSYGKDKQRWILDEGRQIYLDLAAAMPKGADSPEVQAIVGRWRTNMSNFWTPSLDQLLLQG